MRFFLTILVCLMTLSSGAMAHQAPYEHIHPKKQVVTKKKKKKVVYVEEEPEVVKVKKKKFREPDSAFSLRLLGSSLFGSKLGLSPYENESLGGIGFGILGMVDRHWGVEFTVDFLGGGQLDFNQSQVPIQLSFVHFFVPESRVRPYLIGGGGLQFTSLEYAGGAYGFDLTEVTNHFGGGARIQLGRAISISTDLRGVATWATLGRTFIPGDGCLQAGICQDGILTSTGDRVNVGFQFMAAFAYHF